MITETELKQMITDELHQYMNDKKNAYIECEFNLWMQYGKVEIEDIPYFHNRIEILSLQIDKYVDFIDYLLYTNAKSARLIKDIMSFTNYLDDQYNSIKDEFVK